MADDLINLNTASGTVPETINLDTGLGTNSYALDPAIVDRRATKAAIGLADTPAAKPVDVIKQGLSTGQEDTLRKQDAALIDQKRYNDLSGVIAAKFSSGGELTSADLDWIQSVRTMNIPTDPKSVWETSYANSYVQELDNFAAKQTDDNFWNTAKKVYPTDVELVKQGASKPVAQHQFLNTLLENQLSLIKAQSGGDAALDIIPQLALGLHSEAKMRGNVAGVSAFEGPLLDANLEAQRIKLLNQPFPDFANEITGIVENLNKSNLHSGAQFIQAMMGQTTSDRILNGFNTLGSFTEIIGAGQIAKGVGRGIGNSVRQAGKDVVISQNATPTQIKATMLSAVGDTSGAAVEKTTNVVTKQIQGVQQTTARGIEELPRYLRQDAVDIKANPGTLSDLQTNILLEDYKNAEGRMLTAIKDKINVDRVPLQDAPRQVIEDLKSEVAAKHPSWADSIIDIADPIRDPLSNTYHLSVKLGKAGSLELWDTPAKAKAFATMKGIKNPVIVEAQPMKTVNPATTLEGMSKDPTVAKSLAAANKQAPDYKQIFDTAAVRQQGIGYYVEVTKPLNETSRVIRDFIVNDERLASKSPGSYPNDPFYKPQAIRDKIAIVRTAEDTVSPEQRINRKVATYSQDKLRSVAAEEGNFIEGVARGEIRNDPITGEEYHWGMRPSKGKLFSKREWKEFNQTLDYSRRKVDPETERPGYSFKNPKELQQFYLETFDRVPTFPEVQGYFAYKRIYEYGRMLREINMFRNKSRLGAETHTIVTKDDLGRKVRSIPFDGMKHSTLPSGDYNIALFGDKIDQAKVVGLQSKEMLGMRKDLEKRILEGKSQVLELYDPEARPFDNFIEGGHNKIRYVVTNRVETEPLTWNQVNRLGGGHFDFEYDHYIKQADVRTENVSGQLRHHYEGDKTVLGAANRAVGEQVAGLKNQHRLLLDAGKEAEAKAFFDEHLAFLDGGDHKVYRSRFQDTKVNGKFVPAQFSTKEPFVVVPKNKAIIEMSKELEQRWGLEAGGFRDGTRRGSAARNFQVQYTGRRDSFNLEGVNNSKGTHAHPIFDLEPAQMVDPIQSVNRATANIVRSTMMDDYKISAMEAWIKESEPWLQADPSELRSSPFFHFKNPVWKKAMPQAIQDRLMANRFKIDQLVGTPSKWESFAHDIAQDLADASYKTEIRGIGDNGGPSLDPTDYARKVGGALTPGWLLPHLKDPAQFARSVTFNLALGLGAIDQLLVQMATFSSIWAINPRAAMAGTQGMFLHQLTRINKHPEIINWLDRNAGLIKFPGFHSWKPGEFKEAMQLLDRTGFGTVAGEYGPWNNSKAGNIVTSATGQALSIGQTFFKEGEKATRYGAWYTAFKEFRNKNPFGRITDTDVTKILDQADLLYGNMSSASNSMLHTGVLSLPTQFYSYGLRQAEIFMGKRIGETPADRAWTRTRMLVVGTMLFGLPGAMGVSGLPIGDWFRRAAQDNCYVVGENTAKTLVMEGIPSHLFAMINAGSLDPKSKDYFNVDARYANQGLTQVRDALYGDSTFWKIVGGATQSSGMEAYRNTNGMYNAMISLIKQDGAFPMRVSDILDIVNPVKAFSRTRQLVEAVESGRWLNKNSGLVKEDVTAKQAWFMYMSGLNPRDQTDMQMMHVTMAERQQVQKEAFSEAKKEFARAYTSLANNDPNEADVHFKRGATVMIRSGMPEDQYGKSIASAARENIDLISRARWDYYVRNAPTEKKEVLEKAYRVYQQEHPNAPTTSEDN